MKKNIITNIFLMLALMSSLAPLQAQEEMVQEQEQIEQVVQAPEQEAAQEEVAPKKQSWLKKQFNESVNRFKKCWRKECSKTELAKAARDVIIVLGTIAALYAGAKKSRQYFATPTAQDKPVKSDTPIVGAEYTATIDGKNTTAKVTLVSPTSVEYNYCPPIELFPGSKCSRSRADLESWNSTGWKRIPVESYTPTVVPGLYKLSSPGETLSIDMGNNEYEPFTPVGFWVISHDGNEISAKEIYRRESDQALMSRNRAYPISFDEYKKLKGPKADEVENTDFFSF